MSLSDEIRNYEFEGPWSHDGYLVPSDVERMQDYWADKVAELEQENERLRAECGLRQIQGYDEGLERAAEIASESE